MIYEERTIEYGTKDGPVIVDVVSGNATQGSFLMSLEDSGTWREFGRGDIADAIPDVFLVPVSGTALNGRFIGLIGNYAAANPLVGRQIFVHYVFKQKAKVIDEIEIKTEKDGVESCYHLVDFKGK